MKTKALLFVLLFGLSIIKAQTAPTVVVVRFTTDYPQCTPVWAADDCYYRAEYFDKCNSTQRAIVYDRAGYIIHSDWKMTNYYPTRINDYFAATYPGESFQVWSSLDDLGCQSYYIMRDSEKIWFDRNGKTKNYLKC